MYEDFYGFREQPFSLLPDAEFLYLSDKHQSAYNVLAYGLSGQAGFTIITGEVGSGKTTLIQSFIKEVDADTNVAVISNTPRSFESLFKWILDAYELDYRGKDAVELHSIFTNFLVEQNAEGRRTFLIIDEAQNLSAETLEELRILSNVNVSKNLLLQIVLVGQPELLEMLNRPELRQFTQRISISYQLTALDREETQAYIRHRLAVAGGDPMLFTGGACTAVFHLSKGIPRLINGLCDIALVYGFGEGKSTIDVDTILAVYDDRSKSGLGMGTDPLDKEKLAEEIGRLERSATESAEIPLELAAATVSETDSTEEDQSEGAHFRELAVDNPRQAISARMMSQDGMRNEKGSANSMTVSPPLGCHVSQKEEPPEIPPIPWTKKGSSHQSIDRVGTPLKLAVPDPDRDRLPTRIQEGGSHQVTSSAMPPPKLTALKPEYYDRSPHDVSAGRANRSITRWIFWIFKSVIVLSSIIVLVFLILMIIFRSN